MTINLETFKIKLRQYAYLLETQNLDAANIKHFTESSISHCRST